VVSIATTTIIVIMANY